jgi:PAS domain S-box-containing protein
MSTLSRGLRRLLNGVPLRWVLTLPLLMPAIGAVMMVGYLSYRSGQQAVEALGQQLAASTNDRILQELRERLTKPILINRLNVDAVNQGQLDLQSIPDLETSLLKRVQQFESVSAVLFVSPSGLLRIVERYPPLFLATADPPQTHRISIYSIDSQGRRGKQVYVSQDLDLRRDRNFYAKAMATGKPGWSDIHQYGHYKELTLTAFHPVYDRRTQQPLGVFAVHFRLHHLNEFLRTLPINQVGRVVILEPNGNILASSVGDKPVPPGGQNYSPRMQIPRINIGQSQDELLRSLSRELGHGAISPPTSASNFLEFEHHGHSYYVKITPFQAVEGLDWRVLTIIPKSHFLGAIQDNVRTTIVLSLGAVAAAIGIGLLANELLLMRFRHLKYASQQLATGNLIQRLPTDHPIAEFNSLAMAFNQMADQLQQSFDRIKLALAESDEKFTISFRSSPDLIALTTLNEGICIEANNRFYTLLEYSPQEVIGRRLQDLAIWLNPADREDFRTAFQQLGQIQNWEMTVQTRSGQSKTLLLSAEPVVIQGVTYILEIGKDISDRKQAEIALHESQTRFQQFAETVREGFFIYEIEAQTYSYVNSAYIKIIGEAPQSTYQGMAHWLDWIHPDDRPRIDAALAREAQGENFHQEYRYILPGGEIRWLSSKAFPIRDQAGTIVRIVGTVEDVNDRKTTELALQESEARYRASEARFQEIAQTLNQVSYVICIATRQYLYISPAYECLWGYSCESLYQNPNSWLDRVLPEDIHLVQTGLQELFAGSKKRLQYRMLSATGEIRWIESESSIVQDESGSPLRIVGIADDITERKQLEQSLQEREAMLRAIGDNLPKGFIYECFYESDMCRYTYISAGIERLLGLKPEEVIANSELIRSVGLDEDLAYADQVIQEALKHLAPIELQMRHRSKDGEVGWSAIRETPRQLEDGRIVWDGVEIDITDFKQIETALRTSEELFRRAFHDAPIGMSVTTPDGQYLKVNARFCEITGYTEVELLNRTFKDITYSTDVLGDVEGVQQLATGEARSFQMQKRYVTKTGTLVPVLMSTAPIRDHTGELLYFVAHIQDIRDRLKIEQMKDEFISVVSHELRTPLTSIRGALGILESGVFDKRPEKANHMLQIAVSNSDRLVRLVNDILTFERLESGKVQYEFTQCQVTELMQEAVEGVQVIADQTAVTLSIAPLNAIILVSRDEIVQALTNLLSNAIKFSTPGSTVWLRAELGSGDWGTKNGRTDDDRLASPHSADSYILFSVEDQGRGIPSDKFESIFEQFQQVDVSDSRIKGGTGLGLAICKKIVQQHGGQIWLNSTLGQGSTFYFALPIFPPDRSSPPAQLSSLSPRR